MELDLSDHVAVVTGGASGIGRAVAEEFAAEGTRLALWDVASEVHNVARDIEARFRRTVFPCRVDVSDEHAVAQALSETTAQLGPLDHLVHSAAVGSGKFGYPFTNLEPADWKRVLEVNILGMVHVAHAVTPGLVDRQAGTMIFIASVAGQIGSPTDPPYSASKAANINFAQCMAKDLASAGIRVNTVCPGMVKTPLNKAVWQAWNNLQPPDKQRSYQDWADEKVKHVVPLGRWQQPQDIAHMAVFLSSDKAAHVTGQTINVDGGYVMHW